jgi:proteasome lid subunit RPN8/RPN11
VRKTLIERIAKHMESVAPQEGCGFVIRTGKTGRGEKFIPLTNELDSDIGRELVDGEHNPNAAFLIDPKTYIKYSRMIKYIVHSHVHTAPVEKDEPSAADLTHQKITDVPWMIFVIENGHYTGHYVFGESDA